MSSFCPKTAVWRLLCYTNVSLYALEELMLNFILFLSLKRKVSLGHQLLLWILVTILCLINKLLWAIAQNNCDRLLGLDVCLLLFQLCIDLGSNQNAALLTLWNISMTMTLSITYYYPTEQLYHRWVFLLLTFLTIEEVRSNRC